MAIDKKSQHVGNHGGVYTDIDGQTKQFTIIDHDKHTTRLKTWKSATRVEYILTPQEVMIQDISASGMHEEDHFISEFDTTLSDKYQFKRAKQGNPVDHLLDDTRLEDGYYKDLEKIFKDTLKKRIAELQGYLKKDYGL